MVRAQRMNGSRSLVSAARIQSSSNVSTASRTVIGRSQSTDSRWGRTRPAAATPAAAARARHAPGAAGTSTSAARGIVDSPDPFGPTTAEIACAGNAASTSHTAGRAPEEIVRWRTSPAHPSTEFPTRTVRGSPFRRVSPRARRRRPPRREPARRSSRPGRPKLSRGVGARRASRSAASASSGEAASDPMSRRRRGARGCPTRARPPAPRGEPDRRREVGRQGATGSGAIGGAGVWHDCPLMTAWTR